MKQIQLSYRQSSFYSASSISVKGLLKHHVFLGILHLESESLYFDAIAKD